MDKKELNVSIREARESLRMLYSKHVRDFTELNNKFQNEFGNKLYEISLKIDKYLELLGEENDENREYNT